jgi:hypothetical protein
MAILRHCLTVNTLLRKVRWLQSEDDEPAVKISSVIAVLSLTMQPYSNIRTDYAKWITGNYFCCAIRSDFSNVLMLFLYLLIYGLLLISSLSRSQGYRTGDRNDIYAHLPNR